MKAFNGIRAVKIAGEDGLIFYASGDSLDTANQVIATLRQALLTHPSQQTTPDWLCEAVPAYDSLMVVFDISRIDYHGVYQYVRDLPLSVSESEHTGAGQTHRLPVWYGAPVANDLALVSASTGLDEAQIITLHQQVAYRVYAVGFAPGFAYLGELDERLAMPRLANPRKAVPQGAVAIADRQTAVYPGVSPGGWHLLGLCPVPLYVPGDSQPIRLQTGDTVEFYAINQQQYRDWLTTDDREG
ncbi:5-oxoprolinase subunit B family protein [Alteromonas gilva]|uniref:Allophanate hydrolase subunit 1 n=1 Tax=Alteromonas gilva TaxID=2987522 RepID=A0ABT5L2Y9_9ALTE|nr:allophanate hydrolase subunit 1 [Alteromonas gilva]MDC8831227.1 allophanate hydrolase subunit 1 [Alteromonas gilva]